jgi:hypothetical protein
MRFALAPIVAAIVLAGIWITGGVITDDFRIAMLLTALWFALAGLVSFAIGWRWRRLALPVFGTYVVTALAAGGYLAYASMVDRVVDETVAVAATGAAQTPSGAETTARPRNVALARGVFTSGEHTTGGKATLIRLSNGGTVLTLTEFATSPGPDLRVYLVTGTTDDLGDVADLGGLKGNKGNQQYDVPAKTDVGTHRTVVIWCRAFSVPFGSATLS